MNYALERKDYNELVLCGGLSERAPKEIKKKILDDAYPRNTDAAVSELRSRGLNVDAAMLDYLIRKEEIKGPASGSGRNRQWYPENVDEAAEYLDGQASYNPGTMMRYFLNINPAQDIRAQRKALQENPQLGGNTSLLVMTVMPGAPGVGIYATVSYRAMNAKEQAEWNKSLELAKKDKYGKHNS
ncbi:MAG: hypothetical protein ABFD79_11970 [Phycisphaerales bacterium]